MPDGESGAPLSVLVAGASGYLGGYVARELVRRGHRVRALVREPRRLGVLRSLVHEVHVADLTRRASLAGSCDGVDAVFSAVGLMRREGRRSVQDVDHLGNANLLRAAQAAGVRRFVYTSSFGGRESTHLRIVRAHEDFVSLLAGSDLSHAVIRPTGYFSDMGEIYRMARRGRVYLFGDGESRINPIHGADLAEVCADVLAERIAGTEIDVGGPEVSSYRAIAEAAFSALGKRPRIATVPVWLASATARKVRVVSRHTGDVLAFLTEVASTDTVGPRFGRHRIGDYFARLARRGVDVERAQHA